MHVRASTVRRDDRTYRYAQLVQSCRGPDGRSTQRVVKHLGKLPDPVIAAIQVALRAHTSGDAVLLASDVAELLAARDVASRRYLDLAVLIDCWRSWQLDPLLEDLAGRSDVTVPFADALLPLVLQRCCVPGSKLLATRWVPRTALPEILRFEPGAFNNTRVHRTLETLHGITAALQAALGQRYQDRRQGGFRALFMDVTDTWFEGMGCPMAEQTRTKSEMPNKRCIAIVLLVTDEGYPLRWTVVGGKTKDWTAMSGLLQQIGKVDWLRKTPIVFDRAMGALGTVAELRDTGLWFLTAAHVSSVESFTSSLPCDALAEVSLDGTDEAYESDIEQVAQAARADPRFQEIHPGLFAVDLGVCRPVCDLQAEQAAAKATPGRRKGLATQLARAQEIRRQMTDHGWTQAAAAQAHGISDGRVNQILALLRLVDPVQARIAAEGAALPLKEADMRPLFGLDASAQEAAFEAKLSAARAVREQPQEQPPREPIGSLRMVAYFNPRLFVDIRRRTVGHLAAIQDRVHELNAELARATRSRQRDATHRKFSRELERLNYLDTFDVALQEVELTAASGRTIDSFRGSITLKQDVWQRRRRHDGFVLLLGHPDLPHSGKDLVGFYREKDVVEKDFQTIKDFAGLRPVFHYTDPKVLAHVTVCMLALLVERTLRNRLRAAGMELSAGAALEALADCRLTERAGPAGTPVYSLTAATPEQAEILAALGLADLADPAVVRPRLLPRG